MSLDQDVETRAAQIKTDGYAMSIGELTSLYRDGDLDIHPEFRDVLRWGPAQTSRLIESILLGIPIPPVVVYQRDDGRWDVVDGIQRLSAIFEFMGLYRDAEGNATAPSVLESTADLPGLQGCVWNARCLNQRGAGGALSETLQRDVKRSRLDVRIIREESDGGASHDLFHRLNTGPRVSPQEVRDCLLITLSPRMHETVRRLAGSGSFRTCVPLPETMEHHHAYRRELVLRFFVQVHHHGAGQDLGREHDEHITDWMRQAAARFDSPASPVDEGLFERTFRVLDLAVGEDTFRRWDPRRGRHGGAFSVPGYEFTTSGVAHHVDDWERQGPDALAGRIRSGWESAAFRDVVEDRADARRRVPRLVLAARDYFRP